MKRFFTAIYKIVFPVYLHIKRWARITKGQTRFFLIFIYNRFRLFEIPFFFKFITHNYSAKQFNPLLVQQNLRILFRLKSHQGLTCNREGKLHILKARWQKFLFSTKNILFLGAMQKRVERVIFYTYLTITLELNNPFNRKALNFFLKKKMVLLRRLLDYVKKINGKLWDQSDIVAHIHLFERNSLAQAEIIRRMHLAVEKQKSKELLLEAQAALKKGVYPLLVTQGVSGSYWMRGLKRQVLGLFKPFDEEIHAPNNPIGPKYRGALGLRKTRVGCRVGESPHHEVAAYLVDEFFGFGIVPRTYYARFTHHLFFSSRENALSYGNATKTKYGSFQEFLEGFVSIEKLTKEEAGSLPLDEFQLLVVLDVIIGNTDRNTGNILVGDEKIAAIDHGLCFPDRNEQLCFWYWSFLSQGDKPLYAPIVELLNHFPFDELFQKLRTKCFISPEALQCMRERVVLFTQALHAGLVPSQLEELFKWEFLRPLRHLNATLKEAAIEQVKLYKDHYL